MSFLASFSKKLLIRICQLSIQSVDQQYHSRIPPDGWNNRSQVPQAMGIDHSHPRWKVEKLKAHSQHNPSNNHSGPSHPSYPILPILSDAEPSPQHIMEYSNHDVCCHVVSVVPGPKVQISHMESIKYKADGGEGPSKCRLERRLLLIEAEYSNHGKVEAIEHVCSSSKIIRFLRQGEISGMENHAKSPARHTDISKRQVILPEGV